MPEFVIIRMKTKSQFDAAIQALPAANPFKRIGTASSILISDLGSRQFNSRAYGKSRLLQSISMQHWDGVTPPVDIRNLLRGDPVALSANRGRVKFVVTDELVNSVEFGVLKMLIDAGLFEVEQYLHEPAIDHGSLAGLGDDDHNQYVPTDGSRGFSNPVTGQTPIIAADLATKGYVDSLLGGGVTIIPFAFNTPSPLTLATIAAGEVLVQCEVVIQTAFTDPTATLSVGTNGDPSLVFSTDEVDPAILATFKNDDNFEFVAPETLRLFITPGASAAGSGFVLVELSS